MRTAILAAIALLSLAAPSLAGPGGPWQFNQDFTTNQIPPGMTLHGSAAIDNQSLRLTPDQPGQAGLAIIGGCNTPRFAITFDYFFQHIGPGFTADGMSFNLGPIPDDITLGPSWENGPGAGLTFSFDIYDFPGNGSLATYGIRILRDGVVVASAANAITQADRGQWRTVVIAINADNTASVYYNHVQVINSIPTGYVPDAGHRFSFAARTGAESAEQRIDNILLSPITIVSADACADAASIHGDGCFWFDTNTATTDGAAACDSVGAPGNSGIAQDVWFCWTAQSTGLTTFSTVGHAAWDTKMAIYQDCGACPQALGPLACNDNAGSSFQSEIVLRVTAGRRYLVRVGGTPGSADGFHGVGYMAVTTVADCAADFNHSGGTPNVADIFAYLSVWFGGCP